jgi:hypothetical protein
MSTQFSARSLCLLVTVPLCACSTGAEPSSAPPGERGNDGDILIVSGDDTLSGDDINLGGLPSVNAGGGIEGDFDPINNCDPCTFFADSGPVFEDGLDAGVIDRVPAASGSAGPCILEPQPGTLLPANWLRPRVHFRGGTGP